MSISHILEESGPQIASLIDPAPYTAEVQWFFRSSVESLTAFGRIKGTDCVAKISIENTSNDFTALVVTTDDKYNVSFRTSILTKTLTTDILLDYVLAALVVVAADLEEFGLLTES